MERPAGTEDQAQVHIGRLGDHAVVEDDPDLLGERGQRRLPHLLTGRHRGITVGMDPQEFGGLLVDLMRIPVLRVDPGPAGGDKPGKAFGFAEAVRIGGVQGLGDVEDNRRAHQPEQRQRGHRQAEGFQRLVGLGRGSTVLDRAEHLAHEPNEAGG